MKPASLARDLYGGQEHPRLLHSLQENKSSVLSLAATDDYIFSGSQNRDILVHIGLLVPRLFKWPISQVWDKRTFSLKATLCGHTGSVLALEYAKDRNWLFSSGGMFISITPLSMSSPCAQETVGFEWARDRLHARTCSHLSGLVHQNTVPSLYHWTVPRNLFGWSFLVGLVFNPSDNPCRLSEHLASVVPLQSFTLSIRIIYFASRCGFKWIHHANISQGTQILW